MGEKGIDSNVATDDAIVVAAKACQAAAEEAFVSAGGEDYLSSKHLAVVTEAADAASTCARGQLSANKVDPGNATVAQWGFAVEGCREESRKKHRATMTPSGAFVS